MQHSPLELLTFGGLSLRNADAPASGAGAHRGRLALLAVIALSGDRGISRDTLLALFWPESDTERARGALKQALYAVRKDTGTHRLTVGSSELRLNPAAIRCDAVDFQRAIEAGDLERAAALYAGPFLEGVHLRDVPEFERWADVERDRLERLNRKVLERLALQAEGRGDVRAAADWWRRLATVDPLSAPVALSLMRALAAAGDTAGALRHAQAHAALVEDALGLPPDASVTEAADDIRAGALANGGVLSSARGAAGLEVPSSSHGSGPLTSTPHTAPERDSAAALEGRAASPRFATPSARGSGRPRVRAVGLSVVAIILAAVAILATVRTSAPHPGPERILIEMFGNETSDPAADDVARVVSEWITHGIASAGIAQVIDPASVRLAMESTGESGSGDTVSRRAARSLGATLIVRGGLYRRGDEYTVQTRVLRPGDGVMLITPADVSMAAADPSALAESVLQTVLGALAAVADPRFSAWADGTSAPPRYDAYREFVEGLDAHGRQNFEVARDHFISALRLDTTFVEAMLFELWADDRDDSTSVAFRDSLHDVLARRREQLTPFDRARVDEIIASRRGDVEGAYRASHRALEIAPWSVDAAWGVAYNAYQTGRFREVISVIHATKPGRSWHRDAAWLSGWDRYSHHTLGEYEVELEEARRAAVAAGATFDDCVHQIRPLAAMGRFDSVDSVRIACGLRPDAEPTNWLTLGMEYIEHDHPEAGRQALLIARDMFLGPQLRLEWNLGNWDVVESFWAPILESEGRLPERGYAQLGVVAAHRGDTATARDMERRIAAEFPDELHWRAMIPAALGELDRAVDLLRLARRNGTALGHVTHLQPGFLPLHGHPGYQALLRDPS